MCREKNADKWCSGTCQTIPIGHYSAVSLAEGEMMGGFNHAL
jgi:hypothetical protein